MYSTIRVLALLWRAALDSPTALFSAEDEATAQVLADRGFGSLVKRQHFDRSTLQSSWVSYFEVNENGRVLWAKVLGDVEQCIELGRVDGAV